MKQILILGAGKSSSHLIKHLSERTLLLQYNLKIVDINTSLVPESIKNQNHVEVIKIDNPDNNIYRTHISGSFLTVSMLPAFMHVEIAKICLECNSHLITPSYISEEMRSFDAIAKEKGLIFLNEMGFDPGIDHMTTLKTYHEIVEEGGTLNSYKSYAGGLVAAKNDNNPWHYKFSWNPRNVILAGQGGEIVYKKDGSIISLTYPELFKQAESLQTQNGQKFDAYANRDSLKYESLYGWHNISTLMRGTLRHEGFCEAWQLLIELGLTENSIFLDQMKGLSYKAFYQRFMSQPVQHFLDDIQDSALKEKLVFIGFNDDTQIIKQNGTAAEILQSILEPKWKLESNDTDWIVMVHFFEYTVNHRKIQIESFLSLEGEDAQYTAMSKTVGMPIAFAVEMILKNQIETHGVLMPNTPDIYIPILMKLEGIGICFKETKTEI